LSEAAFCGSCGARSWPGASFCPTCGQSLTPDGQVVPPAQPSVPVAPVPPVAPAAPQPFAQPITPVAPQPLMQPFAQPFAQPIAPPTPPAVPPAWSTPFPPLDAPPSAPPAWGAANPSAAPSAPRWADVVGSYPTPSGGYGSGSPSLTAARPLGILMVAAVEVIIALVGLTVVSDLFYWAGWDAGWGGIDMIMGVAYLMASVGGFVVALELWSMRAWAWMAACTLSAVLMGLIVLSVLTWGIDGLDLLGIAAHLTVLGYLNQNSVRRIFRRPPTTFLQFQA